MFNSRLSDNWTAPRQILGETDVGGLARMAAVGLFLQSVADYTRSKTDPDPAQLEQDRALYYRHATQTGFSHDFMTHLATHCRAMADVTPVNWAGREHDIRKPLAYAAQVRQAFYAAVDPHNMLGQHGLDNVTARACVDTGAARWITGQYADDRVQLVGYVQTRDDAQPVRDFFAYTLQAGEPVVYRPAIGAYVIPSFEQVGRMVVPATENPAVLEQIVGHESAGHEYLHLLSDAYGRDPDRVTAMFGYNAADDHLAVASRRFHVMPCEDRALYNANAEEILAQRVERIVAGYQHRRHM